MLSFYGFVNFKRMVTATLLAGAVSFPAMALAAPAVVTGSLNMRAGPGTAYGRIATLAAGTQVDAGPCRGSWCQARAGGYSGWASARYLYFGGTAAAQRPMIYPPMNDGPSPFWGPVWFDNRQSYPRYHPNDPCWGLGSCGSGQRYWPDQNSPSPYSSPERIGPAFGGGGPDSRPVPGFGGPHHLGFGPVRAPHAGR